MSIPTLKIAGVEFALQTFPASQTYSKVEGGSTVHRKLNGAAGKQTHWRKLKTSISGDGWAPAALAGVDWSQPVEIYCIQPRAIHSATVAATLPASRRSDFATAVLCRAVVGGNLVETPVTVATNTATATAVSGATSYQFYYYPQLNFYSDGPTDGLVLSDGVYGWSIEAEEI